jgi:DNA-binding SARP family transcriptional activator
VVERGSRVQVCGPLRALIAAEEIGTLIPVGQARTLFTYLVLNRGRALDRGRLLEVLWAGEAPPSAERTAAALLSRLRAVLGPELLPTRADTLLRLPEPAWVDLETAREAAHRADAAIAAQSWTTAWTSARIALNIASRGLLPGVDLPWVWAERAELDDVRLRALEAIGEASIGLSGAELISGRRAARVLVRDEPLRESGYRLGMRVALAQGNPAEALALYESLRARLADELGVDPGPESQALFAEILRGVR